MYLLVVDAERIKHNNTRQFVNWFSVQLELASINLNTTIGYLQLKCNISDAHLNGSFRATAVSATKAPTSGDILQNTTKTVTRLIYIMKNSILCHFRDPPILQAHNNSDIILRLPMGKRIRDIRWLSVWCRRFTVRNIYILLLNVTKKIGFASHRNVPILDSMT